MTDSKENVLSLDGKTYKEKDLTKEQTYLKDQLNDLQTKVYRKKFELDQLTASKNHFSNLLIASLKQSVDVEDKKETG
jgi:hypothetical protein